MTSADQQKLPGPIDWSGVLRAQGLRVTRASPQVIGVLQGTHQAMTHEDLQAQLQSSYAADAPDKVTVYRILERLCEVNVLKKVAGTARARRYALQTPDALSAFEWDNCHELTELGQDPQIQQAMALINERLMANGMQAQETSLSAHGTCAGCLAATHDL